MIEIPGAVLAVLLKEGLSAFSRITKKYGVDSKNFQAALERHVTWANKWCQDAQIISTPTELLVSNSTIGLTISQQPRRFRLDAPGENQEVQETDLLATYRGKIILGDPGAGKTTTLKRIVEQIFAEPNKHQVELSFPIVLEMRSLKPGQSIVDALCNLLDVYFVQKVDGAGDAGAKRKENQLLKRFIFDLLNESKVLLVMDGLDEVKQSDRDAIDYEIGEFSANLTSALIVATCRSGDYAYRIPGFDLLEILPLTAEQRRDIARLWLPKRVERRYRIKGVEDSVEEVEIDDAATFDFLLSERAYSDLTDRPLFLVHLIIVFRSTRSLPLRSVDVVRAVIDLTIRSWDMSRGVLRTSQYSAFDVDRKVDFLSSVSFELTFRKKTKRFDATVLAAVYSNICRQFALPANEVEEVVREIEGHTGLVHYSSFGQYEFSHLSLQEYLAALYITRLPFDQRTAIFLNDSPAVLAISCSLSSEPSSWLANLVYFMRPMFAQGTVDRTTIEAFIARLVVEAPYFVASPGFGLAVIRLVLYLYESKPFPLDLERAEVFFSRGMTTFLLNESVKTAVNLAFGEYEVDASEIFSGGRTSEVIRLRLRTANSRSGWSYPSEIAIPYRLAVLEDALTGHGRSLRVVSFGKAVQLPVHSLTSAALEDALRANY